MAHLLLFALHISLQITPSFIFIALIVVCLVNINRQGREMPSSILLQILIEFRNMLMNIIQ